MLAYIFLSIIVTTFGLQLRASHEYWYLRDNPKQTGNEYTWSYCDLKCLYLEHYYPDKDFVVIVLTATFHDNFAVCYVKTP